MYLFPCNYVDVTVGYVAMIHPKVLITSVASCYNVATGREFGVILVLAVFFCFFLRDVIETRKRNTKVVV